MSDLYNVKTKKKAEVLDTNSITEGVLSGELSYPKGSKVYVENQYGEKGYIPAEQAAEAAKRGYKLKTSVHEEADKWADKQGLAGAVKVGVGQFVDEALGGIPELILDKTETPLDRAKRQALKDKHDVINTVSGIAGGVGSLAYGGPITKASTKAAQFAERGVAKAIESIAPRATQAGIGRFSKELVKGAGAAGAAGAVLSSPYAVTEWALGDLEAAGESILFGTAAGGLLGAGGRLSSQTAKFVKESSVAESVREAVSDAIEKNTNLKKLSNEFAIRSLGGNTGQRQKLNILDLAKNEAGDVVGTVRSKDITEMGEDLKRLGIITPGASKSRMLERIQDNISDYSQRIRSGFTELENKFQNEAKISLNEIIPKIKADISSNTKFKGSLYDDYKERVFKKLDNLATKGEAVLDDAGNVIDRRISLSDLNVEKSDFQKISQSAYTSPNSGIDITTSEVMSEVPRIINKAIRDKASSLDKKVASEIIESQKVLGNLLGAEKMAVTGAGKEAANNILGLTSYMAGGTGAAVGTMLGGPVGGIIGGLLGGAGRELSRRYGDQTLSLMLSQKSGILFGERALKESAQNIGKIKSAIKDMSSKVGATGTSPRDSSIRVLNRVFREGKKPKEEETKAEVYERANEKLGVFASNPAMVTDKISSFTSLIASEGAPELAQIVTTKIVNSMSYLASALPKGPGMNPLVKQKIKWTPSDFEMREFADKAEIVENPFSAIERLKDNTLTYAHVDALEKVYPKLLQHMRDEVIDYATENPLDLPYSRKVKLSLLLGVTLDDSLSKESIGFYQTMYNVNDSRNDDIASVQEKKFSANINLSDNFVTEQERLLS